MSLLTPRATYAPFEYPEAMRRFELAQASHWLPHEVVMASDINDWKTKLTEAEKNLIGFILKGFTQTEIFVEEYWSQNVSTWFKKPEIQMLAATFASFEAIHAFAYAYLNQSLGLEDFDAFMFEPTAKAKIDRLMTTRGKSKPEIARSLAIFSAFNEGVSLYSSFAVLLNFSRFNKLKGVGQIIGWSIRDECLHSDTGCYLFRTLIQEFPEIWTDDLKKDIYDAARLTIQLEDDFIDKAFEIGSVQGIDAKMLKTFMRHRCNQKLTELTLKPNWRNLDKGAVKAMEWFDLMSAGVQHDDFFAAKPSDYHKGLDFSGIWG